MSQLFVLYTPFVRIPRDIPNSLHITLSDVYVEKDRDATISGTFRDWMSDKPMLPLRCIYSLRQRGKSLSLIISTGMEI